MKIKSYLFILCIICFLTSCQAFKNKNHSPAVMKAHLNQWKGIPIDGIILKLGNANHIYHMESRDSYYIYITQQDQLYPSFNQAPDKEVTSDIQYHVRKPIADHFTIQYASSKCALLFKVNSQQIIVNTNMTGHFCQSTIDHLG